MSSHIKAANGNMVPKKDVEKMQFLYKEILEVIRVSNIKNTTIIVDALLNSIMCCLFNSKVVTKVDNIIEAVGILYSWWENRTRKDTCNKCGGTGKMKGMACICDNCGNVIWGI